MHHVHLVRFATLLSAAAVTVVAELHEQRAIYPPLRLPMVFVQQSVPER